MITEDEVKLVLVLGLARTLAPYPRMRYCLMAAKGPWPKISDNFVRIDSPGKIGDVKSYVLDTYNTQPKRSGL